MRRIISKRKKEKKKKWNQLVVSTVLVLILFLSIFGYSSMRGGESTEKNRVVYNGHEFVEKNGFWFTKIKDSEFSFRYNPNEIGQINSSLNLLENYYDKPLYISSDDIESESEIYRNLNPVIQRMQLACLEGDECKNDELPIKTCEDNFIIIKESDVAEVVQEDNCVFLKGKMGDLTKITDGFLLKIIGIKGT